MTRAVLKLPGYLWALPHTLVGLVLLAFSGPSWWRWCNGALEVGVRRIVGFASTAAQTHGWLIMYRTEWYPSPEDVPGRLRRHERRHVTQGLWGGPVFVVTYVLCFLGLLAWHRDTYAAYRAIPFERDAEAHE